MQIMGVGLMRSLQGLYNNNVSCLRTASGLNLLANPVILKCKLWEYVWWGLTTSRHSFDSLDSLESINSIANTSKWELFLPPSDAYVRSFLYLLYTLIKLFYTKTLSNQASPDWIVLRRPRIPMSFRGSAATFQYIVYLLLIAFFCIKLLYKVLILKLWSS